MTEPAATPRWHLRFANFAKALAQLEEAAAHLRSMGLSELEQAGLIQRFEYTWELGWKSMRDFLIEAGTTIPVPVAANVIRAAHEVGLVEDGDGWIAARKARNQMAHEYSRDDAAAIVRDIDQRYLPLLKDLHRKLTVERERGN